MYLNNFTFCEYIQIFLLILWIPQGYIEIDFWTEILNIKICINPFRSNVDILV